MTTCFILVKPTNGVVEMLYYGVGSSPFIALAKKKYIYMSDTKIDP